MTHNICKSPAFEPRKVLQPLPVTLRITMLTPWLTFVQPVTEFHVASVHSIFMSCRSSNFPPQISTSSPVLLLANEAIRTHQPGVNTRCCAALLLPDRACGVVVPQAASVTFWWIFKVCASPRPRRSFGTENAWQWAHLRPGWGPSQFRRRPMVLQSQVVSLTRPAVPFSIHTASARIRERGRQRFERGKQQRRFDFSVFCQAVEPVQQILAANHIEHVDAIQHKQLDARQVADGLGDHRVHAISRTPSGAYGRPPAVIDMSPSTNGCVHSSQAPKTQAVD